MSPARQNLQLFVKAFVIGCAVTQLLFLVAMLLPTDPAVEARAEGDAFAAVTYPECENAVWPRIPQVCLSRVPPK